MTWAFSNTLNNSDRKSNNKVVVSLTTFPNRIDRIWIVIESILRQSYKPDLIILWLSKDQFNSIEELPKRLLSQQKKGLQIILCDSDLKSHKKYFYAFKEYIDDIIVTFDDDVLYSSVVLKKLLILHEKFPNSICCNVGHRIGTGNDGILPYSRWEQLNSFSGPSYNISFIGVGGVLYPPFTLYKDVFDKDVFEKVCMNADDIWLKAMSLLKKTTVVKSDYYSNYLIFP